MSSGDTVMINVLGEKLLKRCPYQVHIWWEGGVGQCLFSKHGVKPKGTEMRLWLITSKWLIVGSLYLAGRWGFPNTLRHIAGQTNKVNGVDLITDYLVNQRKK